MRLKRPMRMHLGLSPSPRRPNRHWTAWVHSKYGPLSGYLLTITEGKLGFMAEWGSSSSRCKDKQIASSSLPIWFGGMCNGYEEMQWYRVDAAIDGIYEQREARRLHRQQQQLCEKKITGYYDDGDEKEEEGVLLEVRPPFGDKNLGLVVQPDSVLLGKGFSSTALALGPFICCAGGVNDYDKDAATIHCLDTRNIHKGWKTYKMIIPRLFPLMAALNGKIYIAGATEETRWAEVFDPVTHESEPLPPFPFEFELPRFHFMGALPDHQTIFFCSYHSPGYMLYYNVINQSWNFVFDFHMSCNLDVRNKGSVVVGTTMYWFSPSSTFSAYDLTKCKLYSSSSMCGDFSALGSIGGWEDWRHPPTLLHLYGDYFFVVWNDSLLHGTDECCHSQVHCTKLEVHCIDDTESLSVSVLSSHTYLIHGLLDLKYALLGVVLKELCFSSGSS